MPVREAFQRLKGEHLIEFIPYKGVKVLSLDKEYILEIYNLTRVIATCLSRKRPRSCRSARSRRLKRSIRAPTIILMDDIFHHMMHVRRATRKRPLSFI
jgi:DNA-binding GntR family transcriptional regulator